ncbi:MAG: hypothetical protein O7C75_20980 [Verrucomicrobia bacterium]|nr:hypothetical protein [Verrucomicrobiota bacterium]
MEIYVPAMFLRPIIIALSFAVILLSAVLHSDFEAAGWMIDHEHGHSHHENTQTDDYPFVDGEHEPVVARQLDEAGLISIPILLVLAVIPLLGLFEWCSIKFRKQVFKYRPRPHKAENAYLKIWQFVRRCAPESTAPPALN